MGEELQILKEVEENLEGKDMKKYKKFKGAKTATEIRKYLVKNRLNISDRDVFIEGIPNEFDLLLLKGNVKNDEYKVLYEPEDIKAIFEIKSTGIWSKSHKKLKEFVDNIKEIDKDIKCVYVALAVNKVSKGEVTPENTQDTGFDKVCALFYHLTIDSKIGNPTNKDLDELYNLGKISEEYRKKLKKYGKREKKMGKEGWEKIPNTNDSNNWNGLLTYLKTI